MMCIYLKNSHNFLLKKIGMHFVMKFNHWQSQTCRKTGTESHGSSWGEIQRLPLSSGQPSCQCSYTRHARFFIVRHPGKDRRQRWLLLLL